MDSTASRPDVAISGAGDHIPFVTIMSDKSHSHPLAGAGSDGHNLSRATAQEVKAGTLPALTLEHPHHWYDGTLAVAEDVAVGALHEVTQHPGRVAVSFAVGAGTAALASVLSAPVAIAATAAGLAYGGYQIYKHAPGWIHAAEGVAHPENHTQAELARDHQVLQNFGGGVTDIAAGIAGGIAYRAASSALSAALEESAEAHPIKAATTSSTAQPDDGGTVHHAATGAAGGTTGDGGTSSSAHGTYVPGHDGTAGSAHHGLTPVNARGDAAGGAPLEAPATAAMTPEEAALANSIKTTQGIFHQATREGGAGVIESTKQLYNVRFEQVTEEAGRRLITLENRTEGAFMPKGSWIATRLDASGNPVIEDGIQNSWSMQAAKILKTYQVDPSTLESSKTFVAPTRVDGPSVHMVQLDKPLEIMTKWGLMKAKIGDWLANYDFNKAAGTPGKDYAIVSSESYSQTYQPKIK
ncbi:MAG: hypothetical protein JSS86_25030 [Cyanobacteria bacterium SZAS LIN-2]|nr:hypothetical protein [Cyanobacteria bacterium SZAS LIN-2]